MVVVGDTFVVCHATGIIKQHLLKGGSIIIECTVVSFAAQFFFLLILVDVLMKKNIESSTEKRRTQTRHRHQERALQVVLVQGLSFVVKNGTSKRDESKINERLENGEMYQYLTVPPTILLQIKQIPILTNTQHNNNWSCPHRRPMSLSCVLSVSGGQYKSPPTLALILFCRGR